MRHAARSTTLLALLALAACATTTQPTATPTASSTASSTATISLPVSGMT